MKKPFGLTVKTLTKEAVCILAASLLYGMAFNMFITVSETEIIVGGMVGIATTINALWDVIPIGVVTLLLNIPLFIAVFIAYGGKFIIKTLIGTVLSSLSIDLLSFFPTPLTNPLLCATFGGICLGVSLGLYYGSGYNTGGTDLIMFLIRKKNKKFSNGKLLLIIDGIIVVLSSVVLKSYELIFYSVICIFIETAVIDFVSVGFDRARMTFVASEKYEEIASEIATRLERGVTLVDSKGWYSGREMPLVMCVIRPSEVYEMKRIVYGIDQSAFIIFASASEVLGNGFKGFDV